MTIFDEKSEERAASLNRDTPDQLGMGDSDEVAALLSILIDPDEEFPQDDDASLLNNLCYAGDDFDLGIEYPRESRLNVNSSVKQNDHTNSTSDEWKPDVFSKMNYVRIITELCPQTFSLPCIDG